MRRAHLPPVAGSRDLITPSPSTRPFVQFNAAGGDNANAQQPHAATAPHQHLHNSHRGHSRSPPVPPLPSTASAAASASDNAENEFGSGSNANVRPTNPFNNTSHQHVSRKEHNQHQAAPKANTSTPKIINSHTGDASSQQHSAPTFVSHIDECIVCNETLPLAQFEPCGHQISCAECAARMKKCLQCSVPIERRLTQNSATGGAAASMPPAAAAATAASSSSSMSAAMVLQQQQLQMLMQQQQQQEHRQQSVDRLRYLESKIQEIEETHCCSICMERRRNVAFLCGHGACSKCAETLKTCHMCRKSIAKKINLY